MKNIIIGTAGHIDHGKTTLTKALTGIETDRLKEEQKRGITIDLGFAFFELPNGKKAGIVDVPGHERFIKNMLAGVSGIDIVILVIAADEGVMPQTQEHLDILSMLDLKRGIIVLSKCDLVDKEWIELVSEDIKTRVADTFLEKAPIIQVSATKGKGIEELKKLISEMTENVEEKNEENPLRLPIDRVFTMSGFGTVVTGTLIEGAIEEKQTLFIYPEEIEVKVRNIQVHGSTVKKAYAGQRVAVNLNGVKKDEINRGDILAEENSLKNTMIIDVKLNLLKNSKRKIENWTRMRLYHGTKEVLCRAVLLDKEVLNPGESCYAQLRLEDITACKYGDRFVVRYYSPLETIGGGIILDPNATKHKRFSNEIIEELEAKNEGNTHEVIESLILKHSEKLPTIKSISLQSGISEEPTRDIFMDLEKSKTIIKLGKEVFLHRDYIDNREEKLIEILSNYHKKNPLKNGISKEEIRSRLFPQMKGKLFDDIIDYFCNLKTIKVKNNIISLNSFEVKLTDSQLKTQNSIETLLKTSGFKPPTKEEIQKSLNLKKEDMNIIEVLEDKEILIKINEDLIFHIDNYNNAIEILKKHFEKNDKISLGEYRDLLDASRKYVVPLLEHFDSIKLTKRVEDKRVLF